MEPYYYSRMNRTEQSAYHAMKTGLTALAPSFAVPRLENRELADIFLWNRIPLPVLPEFRQRGDDTGILI